MRIAIITDTHLADGADDFRRNSDEGIDWITGADIDLVIHLGDVTANGVIAPGQFVTAAKMLRELRVPLLALPGNHDVGDPTSSHEAPLSIAQIDAFRAAFGCDRWVQTSGAWTLIGVNAQVLGSELEPEQIAWLAEAADTARGPVALFLHKPWFDTGADEPSLPSTRYVPPSSLAALRSALAGTDLRLVASGHVHQFRRRIVEGIEHAWIGSTAFVIPERWQQTIGRKETGVALLTLDGDTYVLEDVKPPRMRDLDLADYPDVYPELLERE